MLGRLVGLPLGMSVGPILNPLRYFLMCYTLITFSTYTPVNLQGIAVDEMYFAHKNQIIVPASS
jgi:hypothetical protein